MNGAALRSLVWADFFLSALLNPRNLYRLIKRNAPKPFMLSFSVPACSVIMDIIAVSLLFPQTGFFYFKLTYGWILLYLYLLFKIVVFASLMDLAAQFSGHAGAIREKIVLVNFSLFPGLFLLPLVYIFCVLNFAPLFFYVAASLGLFVWSAFIVVQGISEMHSVGIGKAVFIYAFPYMLTWVIAFLILLLAFICLFGLTGS